jgi:hypothetical protein
MPRIYCSVGDTFDRLYTQETLAWGVAETQKRAAVRVASSAEWFEIARTAEAARKAYEKAKCDYLDHVIGCPVCDAHVLAPPSVYAAEKRAQVKLASLLARVANSELQPNRAKSSSVRPSACGPKSRAADLRQQQKCIPCSCAVEEGLVQDVQETGTCGHSARSRMKIGVHCSRSAS